MQIGAIYNLFFISVGGGQMLGPEPQRLFQCSCSGNIIINNLGIQACSCSGSDVVNWLFSNVQGFTDRREAKKYATQMLKVT